MNNLRSEIQYFAGEGRTNLNQCLSLALHTAADYGIEKVIVFTAKGEGIHYALELQRSSPKLHSIKLIAVSFPQGKLFSDPEQPERMIQVEIGPERKFEFAAAGIPTIRARLPFEPIAASYRDHGILGQDLSLIGNALSIFGGSMSLCVQAALIACDAGEVEWGEHVIATTSDTAIVIRSAPTSHFLTDFVVREILCKPLFLTVGKKEEIPPSFNEDENVSVGSTTAEEPLLPLPCPESED